MTINRYVEHCPNCGYSNQIPVWNSINAQVDQEAKAALPRGQIKRRPEVGTFLVTGDNLAEVTRRVLNQLWEAVI
jgi:hypothetical protein